MKRLSTKTIATLLVATAAAIPAPGISTVFDPRKNRQSQFDRLLQRHDRKGDIRADILGITSYDFKKMSRQMTFDEIIRSQGMTKRIFRIALLGALRNELRQRGWTATKIDEYVRMRSPRALAVVSAV